MSDSDSDSPMYGRRKHQARSSWYGKTQDMSDSLDEFDMPPDFQQNFKNRHGDENDHDLPPDMEEDQEHMHDSNDMPPDILQAKSKGPKKEDEPPPPAPGTFVLPTSAEQPKVFVLAGACASGKTFMLKSCMYRFAQAKHFRFGITFTATAFTGDYDWAPKRSIHEWDEEYFKAYIKNLKNKVEEGVEKYGKGWRLPHNYVVFDDNNGTLTQSEFMINFISTHRHTSTTVFILSQLLTARGAVSTTMRANTSYAMMWPTASRNALKGLYDNYGGGMTFEEFKAALNECRKRKYSCLVLKNSAENVTVADQFCTIVAPTFPEGFQLKF
jgi:hypothetical protein